jgi:hypothetical protein
MLLKKEYLLYNALHMKNKLFAIILFMALSSLTADDKPLDFIQSPTYKSTVGLYAADTDDFISPAQYKNVEMKKEIIVVSFHDLSMATFAYGRIFGPLYLAFYYGGTLFQGYFNNNYTEYEEALSGKLFKAYSDIPVISNSGNNNRFSLLAGIGNMAIRLSYASTFDRFAGSDIMYDDGSTVFFLKNYQTALGWRMPELQWGMSEALTERGFQPTLNCKLGIKSEYTKKESYDTNFAVQHEIIENSMNYIQPEFSFKLGDYYLYTKPGFDVAVDLDYSFITKLYNNTYNDSLGQSALIKGLNTGIKLTENSYIENSLIPSIGVSFTGMEKLKFKGSLEIPCNLVSARESEMDNSGIVHGQDTSWLIFQCSPAIRIAFQYETLKKMLVLNMGGLLQFASITRASAKTDNYVLGTKQNSFTAQYTNYGEWNDFLRGTNMISCLYTGFLFKFNEKCTMDIMTGLSTENVASTIDFLKLIGFGSILLSLKI